MRRGENSVCCGGSPAINRCVICEQEVALLVPELFTVISALSSWVICDVYRNHRVEVAPTWVARNRCTTGTGTVPGN
ncbi:hypothetical protein J6590_067911, partial [Homalodisca vitripennis]